MTNYVNAPVAVVALGIRTDWRERWPAPLVVAAPVIAWRAPDTEDGVGPWVPVVSTRGTMHTLGRHPHAIISPASGPAEVVDAAVALVELDLGERLKRDAETVRYLVDGRPPIFLLEDLIAGRGEWHTTDLSGELIAARLEEMAAHLEARRFLVDPDAARLLAALEVLPDGWPIAELAWLDRFRRIA